MQAGAFKATFINLNEEVGVIRSLSIDKVVLFSVMAKALFGTATGVVTGNDSSLTNAINSADAAMNAARVYTLCF